MKIIFTYQDRKTIIIGNDYETIINKIRLFFPGEDDSTVLFFDQELDDFFDFTSFDQIQGQPNGVKMMFSSSKRSNGVDADNCSPSTLNNNDNQTSTKSHIKKIHQKRNKKKKVILM